MKYIDIHGHLNFAVYDADRESVISNANNAGAGIINIGSDLASSISALELAKKNENMWAVVGMHPTHSHESKIDTMEVGNVGSNMSPAQSFDFEAFERLAGDPKVVAIGECGLDYFHSEPKDLALQREVFIQHIELANKVSKPLMLHIRNGKTGTVYGANGEFTSAYLEAVSILTKHAKVKANYHFFTGTIDDAKAILDIGGYMSFTGVLTFSRDYDGVIRYIPLEKMMAETDCPYVAPLPYRGKRNEPAYVVKVVEAIARIRGDGLEAVSQQLLANSKKFFGI
jgi:TatD DNase family protein